MDSERKRVAANSSRNVVALGSVWESRMRGSFKVFNGDDKNMSSQQETHKPTEKNHPTDTSGELGQLDKKLRSKQSLIGVGASGKRKTWKPDTNSDGIERTPDQSPRVRSENKKVSGEISKDLSDSMDGNGVKKSPIQKKGRQEWNKEQSVSIDGVERSPIQKTVKIQSLSRKGSVGGDFSDGIERSPVQKSIKIQSLSRKGSVSCDFSDGIERSSPERSLKIQSLSRKGSIGSDSSDGVERKAKSESTKGIGISDDANKGIDGSIEDIEKEETDEDGLKKTRSNSAMDLEEFGVLCEEKLITDDLGKVNTSHKLDFEEEEDDDDGNEQDCNEVTMEEKYEEINEEKSIVIVKQMDVSSERKPISPVNKRKSSLDDIVIEEKKTHRRNERSIPISKTIRKQLPPEVYHTRNISKPIVADELPSQRAPKTHNKLQKFIDLIMWRDVSKSALIFGLGTFSILSSSYTKDLNISFISVVSYLGLIYLAAIFLFRSLISRGGVEVDNLTNNEEYVVGEEEAIWALKLFLPYLNEFLLKVKALFSGDPTTTMKLAVLLFILARCGSSITIWKMAKLGFLGVFTVPKICSSYSSQLTAYGTFWVRRFKDAWESCSHKKAVAFGVFTLVWNLSSVVARIWAVFMLFVAFRFYQQSMVRDEGVAEEEATQRQNQRSGHERRNRKISTPIGSTKPKKIS